MELEVTVSNRIPSDGESSDAFSLVACFCLALPRGEFHRQTGPDCVLMTLPFLPFVLSFPEAKDRLLVLTCVKVCSRRLEKCRQALVVLRTAADMVSEENWIQLALYS